MRALAILTIISLSPTVPAQLQIEHEIPGSPFQPLYGYAVTGCGDVDLDGVDDFAVGTPLYGNDLGSVDVISGLTGQIIRTIVGPGPDFHFGFDVAGIGDVNLDGIPDLAVGAPGATYSGADTGAVFCISGANGSTLWFVPGDVAGERLGYSVGSAGDVNSDGLQDVVTGAPFWAPTGPTVAGKVKVIRGDTGVVLTTIANFTQGEQFGFSVCSAGDFDGNGKDDILVGSPRADAPGGGGSPTREGKVNVIDVASGAVLFSTYGIGPGDELGTVVRRLRDINGDGRPEFIAGAPKQGLTGQSGQARIFLGGSGAVFRDHFAAPGEDLFGEFAGALDDVTGDGLPDYFVSVGGTLSMGGGGLRIYSGFDGSLVASVSGNPATPGEFKQSRAAGGVDVNGDGRQEIVVGMPYLDGIVPDVGTARVYGFTPYPGSGEDLRLLTGVDGAPADRPDVKVASAGSTVYVTISSNGGTYTGYFPALLAQVYPTGLPPATFFHHPELHLDPFAPMTVLYDGSGAGLPAGGLCLSGVVAPGLSGVTVRLQGFVLGPSLQQSNPFFTATDAMEIRIH